jgi:hypothetical protein
MANAKSNVVVLADFKKANEELTVTEIAAFLNDKRDQIRKFDDETHLLFNETHTVKDAEAYRIKSLQYEKALLGAADWLEDKIAATSGSKKEEYAGLLKDCEKIIGRTERIKKNISDDLSAGRHTEKQRELDPVKIVGFIVGTPLTLVNLVKAFASSRTDLMWAAGVGGAALGTTLAFHRQAGALLSRTGRAIKNAPVHMKAAKKATRISCAGFALSAAIAVKPKSEIKPATRPQQEGRPRIIYSAKCN